MNVGSFERSESTGGAVKETGSDVATDSNLNNSGRFRIPQSKRIIILGCLFPDTLIPAFERRDVSNGIFLHLRKVILHH